MIQEQWTDMAVFQLRIAERWRMRATQTMDPYARFFFLFTGFNAMYWLWGKIDGLHRIDSKELPGESVLIANLLGKSDAEEAHHVLRRAAQSVDFFAKEAIERMDRRSAESPLAGDAREGRRHCKALKEGHDLERLIALGKVLYLVRSNLVHGSKMDEGDDEEIIEQSGAGLAAILDWATAFTTREIDNPRK